MLGINNKTVKITNVLQIRVPPVLSLSSKSLAFSLKLTPKCNQRCNLFKIIAQLLLTSRAVTCSAWKGKLKDHKLSWNVTGNNQWKTEMQNTINKSQRICTLWKISSSGFTYIIASSLSLLSLFFLSAFLCCNVAREESVDLIMKEQIMEVQTVGGRIQDRHTLYILLTST